MEYFPDKDSPKKKGVVRRARMLLRARLGWLWGYPQFDEKRRVQWQQLYYPMPWDTESFILSQDYLARASVDRNRIVHDFPRVLPELVGDTTEWRDRVTLKLQALRALIDGESVDPVRALLPSGVKNSERLQHSIRQLNQQFPALQTFTEGFVWWLSLDPEVLSEAVQWLESEQHQLHKLACREDEPFRACASFFALSQLTRQQPVSFLLQLALHPLWAETKLPSLRYWLLKFRKLGVNAILKQLNLPLATADVPEKQRETLLQTRHWFVWAESLLLKHRRERKPYLQALQQLLPLELLDEWYTSQQQLEQILNGLEQGLIDFIEFKAACEQQYQHYKDKEAELHRQLQEMTGSDVFKRRMALVEKKGDLQDEKWVVEEQEEAQKRKLKRQLENAGRSGLHSALSFVPNPQTMSELLDFGVEHLPWLERFGALFNTLQPRHKWYGRDRLLRWVWYWQRKQERDYDEVKLPIVLDRLYTYLHEADDVDVLNRRLMPWSYLLKRPRSLSEPHFFHANTFQLGQTAREQEEYEVFLPLLGELCDRHTIKSKQAEAFQEFWADAPAHWPVVDFYAAVLKRGWRLDSWLLCENFQNLDRLLGKNHSPQAFLKLVETWKLYQTDSDYEEELAEELQKILPVVSHLHASGFGEVATWFMKKQQWRELASLRPVLESLSNMKVDVPSPAFSASEVIDWSHYPEALQTALQQLERYHPQAQKTAGRILSDTFPSASALRQEMAVLGEKIVVADEPHKQAAMRRRLQNLEQRLREPVLVSPAKLQKLADKLCHAAHTRLLEEWRCHCEQSVQAQMLKWLDLPELPVSWTQEQRRLRSLIALCGLGKAERKLASLLLRARLTGEDQDLRNHPQNRQWLEGMERAGIRMQAWLESQPFEVEIAHKKDKCVKLRLQFADDVFDVLQMGDHFDTCLSHDGFNFFSVVANAADLNKRVLYAYDQAGRVSGRCLLGISEQRHLLSFHPYSHKRHKIFSKALQTFITHLENSMGIQRSNHGRIPLLLASDWYDDGVQTLMPEYAALQSGSQFLKALKRLAATDILVAFEQAIAPQPLTELAVIQLLYLEQIKSRADYLFAIHRQASQLNLKSVRMSELVVSELLTLKEASHTDIWPMAKDWLAEKLYRDWVNDHWSWSRDKADLLLSQNPTLMLRLVRKQLVWMKQNPYDRWADVHVYQARALLALKRPRKAEVAYRKAMEAYADGGNGNNRWNQATVQQEMREQLELAK